MTTRLAIAKAAEELIGVPFLHQGRNPTVGIDCAGYIVYLAKKEKVKTNGYIDIVNYGREPNYTMKKLLDKHLVTRKFDQRKPGTILLFAFNSIGQHVGIMSSDNQFFYHAYEPVGKVIKTRLDKRWLNRLRKTYDFIGIN